MSIDDTLHLFETLRAARAKISARQLAPLLVEQIDLADAQFGVELSRLLVAHLQPYTGPTVEEIGLLGDSPRLDVPLVEGRSFRALLMACATGSLRERAEARQLLSGLGAEDFEAVLGDTTEDDISVLGRIVMTIDPGRREALAQWILATAPADPRVEDGSPLQ